MKVISLEKENIGDYDLMFFQRGIAIELHYVNAGLNECEQEEQLKRQQKEETLRKEKHAHRMVTVKFENFGRGSQRRSMIFVLAEKERL